MQGGLLPEAVNAGVAGDKLKISLLPKVGGSENMSRIKMIKPADGLQVQTANLSAFFKVSYSSEL